MNTEKTIRNSSISVLAQIVTLILSFINRRVFILFLDIEYLGYNSLFSNIFSILSIAELGIGTVISFHLYKEIAEKNEEEIGKLMYLYKWLYRMVAVVVAASGVVCSFFLPYFVKDSTLTRGYLYIIYFLQLASVVAGYFLSYRRNLLYATQQEYVSIKIDLFVSVLMKILQFVFLWLFHEYILYLLLGISTNIISNFIIKLITDRQYPYLNKKYKIDKEYIKQKNFISDAGNFLVHKLAYAVYSGTDSIIISSFSGIRMVALYGNYITIKSSVENIFYYRLLNPVQATIGNIIYADRNIEDVWHQFNVFELFGFFLASYLAMGFLIFYQPAIQIWMGEEYLLPMSFVILLVVTMYFSSVWEIVYKYRSVFGDFQQDRNLMMLSALLNIVISIPGAIIWGISGVQLGTLIAFFPIAYGRIRFVVKNYFGKSLGRYFAKHALFAVLATVQGAICYFATRNLPVSVSGIALRFVVWSLVPGVVCVLSNINNPYLTDLKGYMRTAFSIISRKIRLKGGFR